MEFVPRVRVGLNIHPDRPPYLRASSPVHYFCLDNLPKKREREKLCCLVQIDSFLMCVSHGSAAFHAPNAAEKTRASVSPPSRFFIYYPSFLLLLSSSTHSDSHSLVIHLDFHCGDSQGMLLGIEKNIYRSPDYRTSAMFSR